MLHHDGKQQKSTAQTVLLSISQGWDLGSFLFKDSSYLLKEGKKIGGVTVWTCFCTRIHYKKRICAAWDRK